MSLTISSSLPPTQNIVKSANENRSDPVNTYEKSETSDVLLISDEGHLATFYYKWMETGVAKTSAWEKQTTRTNMYEDYMALATERYDKIRSEIDKTFADGDPEKEKHYNALDKAFQGYLEFRAWDYETSVQYMEEWQSFVAANPKFQLDADVSIPRNPLTEHKDFNITEFSKNLKTTLAQFGKAFVQNIKNNSYEDAWAKTINDMGTMETQSVNNLSFSDLRVILTQMKPYEEGMNWPQELKNKYTSIANDSNLSDFMRKIYAS